MRRVEASLNMTRLQEQVAAEQQQQRHVLNDLQAQMTALTAASG